PDRGRALRRLRCAVHGDATSAARTARQRRQSARPKGRSGAARAASRLLTGRGKAQAMERPGFFLLSEATEGWVRPLEGAATIVAGDATSAIRTACRW